MKTTITLTVRDVFDYFSDGANYERIIFLTGEDFRVKYPQFEEVSYNIDMFTLDSIEEDISIDYFNLIVWDNDSPDEFLLQFFVGHEKKLDDYYNLEVKKIFIKNLKEDINSFLRNANRFFNILPAKA